MTILIVITLRGMKAFPLNFLVGDGFLLVDGFHRFSVEKPGWLHKISVCRGSSHGEIRWRILRFALPLFICLLFAYLFIVCLFMCLFFVYFKRAVCWVKHKLCGLTPFGKWGRAIIVSSPLTP